MNKRKFIEESKEKLSRELFEIENRTDISESEKIDLIIRNTSLTCSAIAVQPIPFADIFILTPIQAYMGSRIAAIKGIPINESEDLIKEILGTLGLAIGAQQVAISLYKMGLPGLGGFMTIPLVYGLTYGIGSIMDYYFTEKRKDNAFKLSESEILSLWRNVKNEGEKIGQQVKPDKPKVGIFVTLLNQINNGLDRLTKAADKAGSYTKKVNESAETFLEEHTKRLEEKRRLLNEKMKK